MADHEKAELGVRMSTETGLVEYGAVVDGVFHPFAAERTGDYQDRQHAGKEAQAEAKSSTGTKK